MAHIHPVYDDDPHFLIKPESRSIVSTSTERIVLIKGDHNSEIFTFEMPREVDKHDMSQCNLVQIHYINSEADSRTARSVGVYQVEDLQVSADDENTLVFSWLISTNATKFVGPLNFAIRFACLNGSKIEYAWNTSIFGNVSVATSIDNTDTVIEQYDDTLQKWYEELVMASIMSEAAMEAAKEEAKEEMIEEASDIVEAAINEGTADAIETVKAQLNAHAAALKTEIEETVPNEAVKARKDANGNLIHETYVAKNDAEYANSALEEKLTNGAVVPAKADTAVKATHDAEGNDIAETYLPKGLPIEFAKAIDASQNGQVQIKPKAGSDKVEFNSYDEDDLPITKYDFRGNGVNSVVLDIVNKTINVRAEAASTADDANLAHKIGTKHITKASDLTQLAMSPNITVALTFMDKVTILAKDGTEVVIPLYSKGYMIVGPMTASKPIMSLVTPELKTIVLIGEVETVSGGTTARWTYKDKPDEAVHAEKSDHADASTRSTWTEGVDMNKIRKHSRISNQDGISITERGLYAVVIGTFPADNYPLDSNDDDPAVSSYYTKIMYIDPRYKSTVKFEFKTGTTWVEKEIVYDPDVGRIYINDRESNTIILLWAYTIMTPSNDSQ